MFNLKMNALQSFSYRDADFQKFEDTATEVNEIYQRMAKFTDKLPSLDRIELYVDFLSSFFSNIGFIERKFLI